MPGTDPHSSFTRRSHWRKRLMQSMQMPAEDLPIEEVNVGQRLQELRAQEGVSLRMLAELSGLNVNTLSLIENKKTSPNVNTLQQIANALQVPITAFFERQTTPKSVVFQKAGHRPHTEFPQGILEDLGGGLALGEGTPLLMTLLPDACSDPESITHSGQEFFYCLEGCMLVRIGYDEYTLEPGDSLIFEAHIPHRMENRAAQPSRALYVICPSDNSDRFVTQHLEGEQKS